MTSRVIQAQPLDVEAYRPFGRVVSAGLQAGSSANQGSAVRYDFTCELINARTAAKPNLAVFRSVPRALPFDVVLLERHPFSTQVFIPMVVSRYLVVVAPTRGDGAPDLAGLSAFLCAPGQGVSYSPGTWHHPMIALETVAEFSMLAWEDGSAGDCEVRQLGETIRVVG